ncbi:maltose ABC transporter permease MalF [Sesbania bispinosa]|nr:maltose ABC transporter permease MalF [Sesbania bispinosa]
MVDFYVLECINIVHSTYAGTNFFDIKIENQYHKEISYPKNGGWKDIVLLDSDNNKVKEEERGEEVG